MRLKSLLDSIARITQSKDLTEVQKIRNIKDELLIGQNRSREEVLSSVFMVTIGVVLILVMAMIEANYYADQEIGTWKMRSILALAAGAMSVGFTGNINIKFHWVQASGSLAVVFLFYFVNPGSIDKQITSATNMGLSIFPSAQAATSKLNETEKFTLKIVYPIGIRELKQESFSLRNRLGASASEVSVYSRGSYFRAPINALRYDGEFDFVVTYHHLVDKESIESLERLLGDSRSVVTQPGYSGAYDMQIQLRARY